MECWEPLARNRINLFSILIQLTSKYSISFCNIAFSNIVYQYFSFQLQISLAVENFVSTCYVESIGLVISFIQNFLLFYENRFQVLCYGLSYYSIINCCFNLHRNNGDIEFAIWNNQHYFFNRNIECLNQSELLTLLVCDLVTNIFHTL